MATAILVALTVLSAVVLVAAFSLFVTLGAKELHTPIAIAHDGLKAGRRAPPLDLSGLGGDRIVVPNGRRQVLLFTDHSLIDFPDLLSLLTSDTPDHPDVVVLGSTDRTSGGLLEGLRLRVPAAVVTHDVYHRYRIRVMPYAVVVDADGKVETSRLVNTAFQLRHIAQVGRETEAPAAYRRAESSS